MPICHRVAVRAWQGSGKEQQQKKRSVLQVRCSCSDDVANTARSVTARSKPELLPDVQGCGGGQKPPTETRRACDEGDSSDGIRKSHWLMIVSVITVVALAWTQVGERRAFRRWTKQNHEGPAATDNSVALVVPVLNEAATLSDLFQHLTSLDPPPQEIICVDGQSTDRTASMVKKQKGVTLVRSKRGRSCQMNAGAAAASTKYMCFLHADSRPCKDLVNVVRFEMADPGVAMGGFITRITHNNAIMPWQTTHHFLKTYYMPLFLRPRGFFTGLRCLLGDQTLFVRKRDFWAAGGFREDLAIMEDADLSIRMHLGDGSEKRYVCGSDHKSGSNASAVLGCSRRRKSVRHVVYRSNVTSGRRMAAWGPLKSTFLHFKFGLMWYFGCTPAQLKEAYNKLYTDAYR